MDIYHDYHSPTFFYCLSATYGIRNLLIASKV